MSEPLKPEAFVLQILDQVEAFLVALPAEAYSARVSVMEGSIGGHLRHSLEHVAELLRGLRTGEVYFERRERDPQVESNVDAALAELRRLRAGLAAAEGLEQAMSARSSLSGRLEESLAYPSSPARELVYVGLHFTHHMALMAVAARAQGLSVPDGFGKAPATLAYERASR